ncbi:hypothetical protein Hdeb2414_s0562g00917221 [Helianthus debilis subsp. tardiflorus]
MSFMYEHGLPFLLFLIRSSPNMENLSCERMAFIIIRIQFFRLNALLHLKIVRIFGWSI